MRASARPPTLPLVCQPAPASLLVATHLTGPTAALVLVLPRHTPAIHLMGFADQHRHPVAAMEAQ